MVNWPQEQQSWWPSLRREDNRILGGWWRKAFIGDLGNLGWCCRRESGLSCRMTRWRRSTREGSIYRTKRARANLTYLFAVSVKSEDTQVDMVTVRTIIKGLRRWFDRKRSWSGDISQCEISWSVHRRMKWRDPFWKVEEFEEPAGELGQSCSDLNGRLPNWEN